MDFIKTGFWVPIILFLVSGRENKRASVEERERQRERVCVNEKMGEKKKK